jgi:L-ascorbate metabolism protein UlaG (beta-lactamase superfamily)
MQAMEHELNQLEVVMKRNLTVLAHACLLGLLLCACVGASPTAAPSPMPIPATPTVATSPTPTMPENVTIQYEATAQFELISSTGRRVLIDVERPDFLTSPATDQDILLITHSHPDHYNPSFAASFPGRKLIIEEGQIQLPDVSIRGIAAGHNATSQLMPKGGDNYIFIVDMAGLRIVHFGDIGQDALTPGQLEALGQVDVAMMQFENFFSAMNSRNMKGFNLMDQVKPRIILHTHSSTFAVDKGVNVKGWKAYTTEQPVLTLTREQVPADTTTVLMGSLAEEYRKTNALPLFGKP